MGKTIGFVETMASKVVKFDKEEVRGKQGNLVIMRSRGEGYHYFRVYHFGTCILELNFGLNSSTDPKDLVCTWHIQSATDANYISTVMNCFNWGWLDFRTGYRPVSGGGYFEFKNNDGEWVSFEGGTSSQW